MNPIAREFAFFLSQFATPAGVMAVLLSAICTGGCATHTPPARQANYTLVYLTTGSANPPAEERKTIFAGHMANIQRLADEKKLVIAGPFDRPGNPAWRGIFIFDVPTIAQTDVLVATDPGIKSGVFTHETHILAASPELRKVPEFERELNAAKGEPEPKDPGANIRRYVMVTADDTIRIRAALNHAHLSDSTVWWGTIDGGKQAVFVLDSASPDEVRAALSAPGIDAGHFVADAWWSSKCLERLRGNPAP